MILLRTRGACGVLAFVALGITVGAQTGVTISGRLFSSLSGEPIPGATVVLEELRRETLTATDGTFRFEQVAPGMYHLGVRAEGFLSRRIEVTVSATSSPSAVEVSIDPEIHYEEVLSVSPEPRSQFESYQPTTVLAGQDLSRKLEMSLGGTLESEPGVASRSFGPAPARPVIRGLDGDRVLILQDGQRTGDLSSQSGDHGVSLNPAAARRIEVVRGPATLLYGANAIGGLINVITQQIPTQKVTRAAGNLTIEAGTAAREGGAAGELLWGNGTFALQAGGGGRRSGDVRTPAGEIANSQSRNGFSTVGLSWTGDNAYVGGSYGYDNTRYGVPVIEAGRVQLTPQRHALSLRAGAQQMKGIFESFRATVAQRRYRHEELEDEDVGTRFRNNTTEIEVLGSHRAAGRLKGSVGAWLLDRAFFAQGEEALSVPVDQRSAAAFIYEELAWPHATVQFGARVERTRFEPDAEAPRAFTNLSGSAGLLLRPAAGNDNITVALSVARATRNPALEELFYFGEHPGNFAFEVGSPDLSAEKALGFDVSFRWRSPRATGEVTYFRNDINDYIFRNPLNEETFRTRESEFAARFPGRSIVREDDQEETGGPDFQLVEFVGADSVLQGIETHTDVNLTSALIGELGLDYVRGSLKQAGNPLPRMPPFRARGGLRWQHGGLQAGGEFVRVGAQKRVSGAEQPTAGYGILKLFSAYSFPTGHAVSTITVRLDNVADKLYRNHLSLIKDFVPETGRNLKVLYNVVF